MSRANPASAESSRGVRDGHVLRSAAIAPMPAASISAPAKATRLLGIVGERATMTVLYYACRIDHRGWPHAFDVHLCTRMMDRVKPRERQQRRQESRQESKAVRRASAERTQRRSALFWRGAAVLLVIGAVAVSYSFYSGRQFVKAVKTGSYPAGLHQAGRITYTESPPMGGPHNVAWQNCGIYDVPIHNEHAVHSLEHGAVWITYRPDLPASDVQRLKATAADDFMLLSPYPGLATPIVASAWNHQMPFTSASDPGLKRFIDEYKNNPTSTPEFGAPCAGGTSATAADNSLGTRGF